MLLVSPLRTKIKLIITDFHNQSAMLLSLISMELPEILILTSNALTKGTVAPRHVKGTSLYYQQC